MMKFNKKINFHKIKKHNYKMTFGKNNVFINLL